VAALLAAVQVKVAAYALVRIVNDVLPPGYAADDLPLLTMLAWFGLGGVVVGSVMAIRQREVKAMLAHSTVAQLGYIAVGVGLATPLALVGALLHVVSHAAMKGCLFFAAGAAIDRAGAKKIAGYAGLGARMPWTMAGFTVAAISMVGLPPTAGFFSKWYLVLGAGEAGRWVIAAAIGAASLLTLVYVLRMLELVWFGERDAQAAPVAEASFTARLPVLVLAAVVLVVGLGNAVLVDHVLEPVARALTS
jgi:multicomponent Na+:H+ antiporter subunit D